MLAGHDLVYFGPERWEGLWRNRHWLMSIFARTNRVLYVEPRRHLRAALREWRDGQLSLAPWRWRPLTHVADGLYVYHSPPFAPVSGQPLLAWATRQLRRALLRATAEHLGISRPIVWISRPTLADLSDVFESSLTIYHAVDDYAAYPGRAARPQSRLKASEQATLRCADLVIVCSQSLLAAKRQSNPNTFMVPNAVHYAGYQRHLSSGARLPRDLAAVPAPRIGYLGLIGSKLDFDLLEAIARARPDWSLVFLGAIFSEKALAEWNRLCALPNVHYLGMVSAQHVPEYVSGFDVGLMPYRHSEHAQNIDPLKLYDYLAAGKPVVSIDIPAVDGFRHVVRTAGSPAEFVAAIEAALRENPASLVQARRELASANSWEQRAEQISSLIQERLSARGAFGSTASPSFSH